MKGLGKFSSSYTNIKPDKLLHVQVTPLTKIIYDHTCVISPAKIEKKQRRLKRGRPHDLLS